MTAQNPFVNGCIITIKRFIPVIGFADAFPDRVIDIIFCLGVFCHDLGIVARFVMRTDRCMPGPVEKPYKLVLTDVTRFFIGRQYTSKPVDRVPGGGLCRTDIEDVILGINDGIGGFDDGIQIDL